MSFSRHVRVTRRVLTQLRALVQSRGCCYSLPFSTSLIGALPATVRLMRIVLNTLEMPHSTSQHTRRAISFGLKI